VTHEAYQHGGNPEDHVTDVIGVGQVSGNDHLAGANRQIEAT